ncbi:hypothetical protein MPTK1_8g01400 [Marchantia polymorpha subsp. ruderalis]|uniref:Uncharacterized protein n=1 Tax=Marchantia polymorpha TaxID=3197 RepID=A0A2R6WR81_MARPO|nr:hypothetical protein MARPO_0064s0058 [Marchantia polymorpha]BBN18297.1 hypothetical protein Mp_8g01400 [Marchantia polymorpha subsp. ruderalis]|eukprot:PTQ36375.1 hypothetical protein MARPO_0064s0058 [Marchantia polymorpha]
MNLLWKDKVLWQPDELRYRLFTEVVALPLQATQPGLWSCGGDASTKTLRSFDFGPRFWNVLYISPRQRSE